MSRAVAARPVQPHLPSGFAPYRRRTQRMPWLVRVLVAWDARHRMRRHLSLLSDHQLRDIGLTREDVRDECAKPFWQM